MTQTLEDFAELNDYSIEKAERVVRRMYETTENPGLKAWAEGLLADENQEDEGGDSA